jgi:hypothetical protein
VNYCVAAFNNRMSMIYKWEDYDYSSRCGTALFTAHPSIGLCQFAAQRRARNANSARDTHRTQPHRDRRLIVEDCVSRLSCGLSQLRHGLHQLQIHLVRDDHYVQKQLLLIEFALMTM